MWWAVKLRSSIRLQAMKPGWVLPRQAMNAVSRVLTAVPLRRNSSISPSRSARARENREDRRWSRVLLVARGRGRSSRVPDLSVRRGGAAGDFAESGYSELDSGGPEGHLIELGEFGFRARQADPESFGLAVPAFPFGLADPVEKVVEDLGDS